MKTTQATEDEPRPPCHIGDTFADLDFREVERELVEANHDACSSCFSEIVPDDVDVVLVGRAMSARTMHLRKEKTVE